VRQRAQAGRLQGRRQGLGLGVADGAQCEEAADHLVRFGLGAVGGQHAIAFAPQVSAAVFGGGFVEQQQTSTPARETIPPAPA
jgi:hypothetical protein